MALPAELDIFTNGDNDQPIECPKCGSRTDFSEIAGETVGIPCEQHQCLKCSYAFVMQYDED